MRAEGTTSRLAGDAPTLAWIIFCSIEAQLAMGRRTSTNSRTDNPVARMATVVLDGLWSGNRETARNASTTLTKNASNFVRHPDVLDTSERAVADDREVTNPAPSLEVHFLALREGLSPRLGSTPMQPE